MKLLRAHVVNFRNYKDALFTFGDGINLILGKNAQGKTNLLEAIYLASLGSGFRSSRPKELIREGETNLQVGLLFCENNRKREFYYRNNLQRERELIVDSKNIGTRKELFGEFPMALFEPDSLKVMKDSPAFRRQFMDREISLLDHAYLYDLVSYNRSLLERNATLKLRDYSLLDIYDERLSEFGAQIIEKRCEFVKKMREHLVPLHKLFTLEKEEITMEYQCFLKMKKEEKCDIIRGMFLSVLKENREKDLSLGYTSQGTHSDDIDFYLNGKSIRRYASTGQVRLASLSVFFSLVKYIEEKKKKPLILLDDVFSELDEQRRYQVLQKASDYQSFITATDVAGLDDQMVKEGKKIVISAGKIMEG